MLLPRYHKKFISHIVTYLLLCVVTLNQLIWAGTTHQSANFHPSPPNQSPITRLAVVPNMNPISTVATFSIPPQNVPTTSAPFPDYDHHQISTTTTTTTIATQPPTQAPTLVTTLPASSVSPTLVSRPTTMAPILPQESRHMMTNLVTTTTTPPDDFMVFRTTSQDPSLFKPNRSFEDLSFMGSNSDLSQQPPSQPQDNSMLAASEVNTEVINVNVGQDSNNSPVGTLQEQQHNNFNQPNLNQNHQLNSNQTSVPTAVMPDLPLNISQILPPNFAPSASPAEVESTHNVTLPLQNSNLTEVKINNKPEETLDVSQISPEGRSEALPAQPGRPAPPQPVAPQVNSSAAISGERRHQILKPKSKFKCTQESDCNNGACIRGTCFCEQGFTGESCAINIDECLQFGSQSCLNNGTCVDEINGFRCDCPPGFRGDRCQDLADMCNDSPCLNNATCVNHRTSYTCNCEPGWEGRHCELNVNDCLKNPCENNAVCQDLVNGYRCECPLGFSGTNCEINVDDCDKNMCKNNSTCRDLINDYECVCRPGFAGKNCEENIDECINMPCQHGECTDGINSYKCTCHDGYTGLDCDKDIDECDSDRPVCQNGGTCINTDGSFKCSCKEGFSGKECSVISDFCKARQPCKNGGICKNINSQKALYQCQCYSGYLGTHCERRRACDPHDCNFDHAHCVSNVTCACLPGRREERTMCEYVTSCEQVEGDLCLHGGKCKNLEQGGYHCACQDPWYGPVCQFQAETQFDAILLVVITCVGFLLAACAIVSLVIFRSVRKARATRGTYSPSTQEKFGNSADDLLKLPVPERLI